MDGPSSDAPADGSAADGPKPDGAVGDTSVDGALPPDSSADSTADASTDTSVDSVQPDAPAGCGNGVREGTEECDDGNNKNLDGCDYACRFEQSHRINWLQMQWSGDTFCPQNAFGKAIVAPLARSQLQTAVDDGIKAGSITVLFKMMNLDDLSGANDNAIIVGALAGTRAAGSGYDGTQDLDWWYTVDPNTIDANRNPVAKLNGQIANSVLTAGPGQMSLTIDLIGSLAKLKLTNVRVSVKLGSSSKPLASSGTTPGHLASERLDPALSSFETAGKPTPGNAGGLCGAVSAASLAVVPVPSVLVGGLGCAGYTTANTMLDIFVGGCKLLGFIDAISPTQPDVEDPTAPAAGAGPSYTLSADPSTKRVNACKDKNGQTANLTACLNDAAYSSYFKFGSGRVIIR